MLLVHAAVSFMLQGYGLLAHACHLLGHFSSLGCSYTVLSAWDFNLPFCVLVALDVAVSSGPGRLTMVPHLSENSSDSRPWNAIHSSACLPGSCALISSSRMRSCQYNNHRKRKPFLPPLLLVSTQPIFTQNQPSGQAAIKNPGPFGEGVGAREPQIYKLDFHSFPSRKPPIDTPAQEASTVWTACSL